MQNDRTCLRAIAIATALLAGAAAGAERADVRRELFDTLVRDIADRKACEARYAQAARAEAYWTLAPLAWTKHGNAHRPFGRGDGWQLNETSYSIPGRVGARASKLLPMLENGHMPPPTSADRGKPKVTLPPDALHRITLWMDANSVFYGGYKNIAAQARGARPTVELE